ncbi:hypothetical protein TSMEX_010988 [Taenia solium]|eukprot:TsM_000883400 transcript=TsM_000883400 gene=TsM_000883400
MDGKVFLPSVFQAITALHGGVDFVPLNETGVGIALMLTIGLWKIHYSRAINAPRADSSFQVCEAHFTVLKTISDVCLSSGLRAPYFAESARILLGIALLVMFCNFFTLLFSRKAFLFTMMGGGLACMSGIFMTTIWLIEVLGCTRGLSLDAIAPNASRVVYMRTLDARPVILTTSFYHYLICALIFVFETPFVLLKMKA